MVAIDPAEWDRERQAARRNADGLSEWDLEQIGRAVRIDVPCSDKRTLALAADLLRGIANEIEFTLQRDEIPLRMRLQSIRMYAHMVNRRLREQHAKSNP